MRFPSPNRLAVYFVAASALLVAVAPVVIDLDFTSVAAAVGSLAVLGGVVAKWLTGWQNYEKAVYTRQINEQAHAAQMEQAAAVSRPGGAGKRLDLPR